MGLIDQGGVESDVVFGLFAPDSLLAAGLAMALCGTAVYALRHVSERLGLVDFPHSHKTHLLPTAVVGGIAIVGATLLVALLLGDVDRAPMFWIGLVFLTLIGVMDDRRGLSPRIRFAAQIVASLVMVLGGHVQIVDFGELLWPGHLLALGWLSVPVTVFSAVGLINSINMIDGLDGLCGGIVLFALLVLAVLAALAHDRFDAERVVLFGAAVLGFLVFNIRIGERVARAFLGNAGSLALGYVLAWNLIGLSQGVQRAYPPVLALWLLAVPLIDTVSVMWRRIAQGASPFAADHQHMHHLLRRAGRSVQQTVALILALSLALALIGLSMVWLGCSESASYVTFLLVALAYHFSAARIARKLPPIDQPAKAAESA